MKNKKIILTNLNNDNHNMITQAKDSNELEAVINLEHWNILEVIELTNKDLKSIKYGKDVTNYKVNFNGLKDQSLNIKENSSIILSIVDEKQTNDPGDKKMTNKDIINTLNLILNEMSSFKSEVKEEFKKVNSRIDNMETYVKEEFKNVNSRIDKLETFVKEEFENHVKKYHS